MNPIYGLAIMVLPVLEPQQKTVVTSDTIFSALPAAPDKNLKETWYAFAAALVQNDATLLRKMSTDKIYCPDCVFNTEEEELNWERYKSKNPDTWYDKLYKELSYLRADSFVKEDVPVVFNKIVKNRLLNTTKLTFVESKKRQEVLVTVVDPSERNEGRQAVFAFEKTARGYLFCGYSTIP